MWGTSQHIRNYVFLVVCFLVFHALDTKKYRDEIKDVKVSKKHKGINTGCVYL